jgi:hypothetical protein
MGRRLRRVTLDAAEAIYRARDAAVEALEEERYGDALRLLASITARRAQVFPSVATRHQVLVHVAEVLHQVHNLMEDLSIDSDIDEE